MASIARLAYDYPENNHRKAQTTMKTNSLRMRPGKPGGVMLHPVLLVGKGILHRLAGTYTADRVLPAPLAAVIRHKDVLLHERWNYVMQDDVTRRPAAGLEPG